MGDELRVGNVHNFGDMAIHILYINYFADGIRFWPDNPLIANQKLSYYIGSDFFNSIWIILGSQLSQSLVWVGLLSSLAAGVALYLWGGSFAMAGFLFNGGLELFSWLKQTPLADPSAIQTWHNLPQTIFIPQRAFLYALPAGLLLLTSWRDRFFKDPSNRVTPILRPWQECLLYSCMPLFQIHTFMYLTLLLMFWIAFYPQERKKILMLLLISLPPSIFFARMVSNNFGTLGCIHWSWGWEQGTSHPVAYWLMNFGILPVLIIALMLKHLIGKRDPSSSWFGFRLDRHKAFIYPAVLFFILFCHLMMSPWNWDNIKLVVWSYLILLPFLWQDLLKPQRLWIKTLLISLLFIAGIISITQALYCNKSYSLYKISELYEIQSAISRIPYEERFACAQEHLHPLLYFGRKVTLGYGGWIFSLGLPSNDINQKYRKLMSGDANWKTLAHQLNTRYLFWGRLEDKAFRDSLKPWQQQCNVVSDGPWGKIYDLYSSKN